jgi:hypothetical protein
VTRRLERQTTVQREMEPVTRRRRGRSVGCVATGAWLPGTLHQDETVAATVAAAWHTDLADQRTGWHRPRGKKKERGQSCCEPTQKVSSLGKDHSRSNHLPVDMACLGRPSDLGAYRNLATADVAASGWDL